MNDILPALVSFGADITKPHRLETRRVGGILQGIATGEWQESVQLLRQLRGQQQQDAKRALPFFIPTGTFSRKQNDRLVRYSGIVVIDLDCKAKEMMHRALDDRYCFAAFRSPRGRGVKLLFRVPRRFGPFHKEIFPQVRDHVRRTYGVEPDTGQSDVCRACFVSWDAEMVIKLASQELPIVEPATRPVPVPVPTVAKRTRQSQSIAPPSDTDVPDHPLARLTGTDHAPRIRKPDGSVYTHQSLLELAKRLALHVRRGRLPSDDVERLLDDALRGWFAESHRRRQRLNWGWAEYRKELGEAFHKCPQCGWFEGAATKWTRWQEHPEFPQDGTACERLLFAIRSHCKESGRDTFFLSSRDASTIAGVSHKTGPKLLRRLRTQGVIELTGRPHGKRQALTYRLR